MKTVLLTIFGFGCVVSAHASSVPGINTLDQILHQLKKSRVVQISSTPGPKPAPPLAPIRTVKAKIRVQKSTFKQNGTKVETKIEEVCEKMADVDVFDVRGLTDYSMANQAPLTCPSTLEGKPVDINVGTIALIGSAEIFQSEPAFDVKVFAAFSYATNGPTLPWPGNFSVMATRDLGLKSSLLQVVPPNMVSCSVDTSGNESCTATFPELFTTTAELQD